MTTRTSVQPTPPPEGAILLTYPEAAFVLRCSVTHIYREVAAGRLARRKSGRKSLIHRDDLAAYVRDAYRRERPDEGAAKPASPERVSLREAGLWDGDDFGSKRKRGRGR